MKVLDATCQILEIDKVSLGIVLYCTATTQTDVLKPYSMDSTVSIYMHFLLQY